MINSMTVISLHTVDNLNVVEGGWFDWTRLAGPCVSVCARAVTNALQQQYKCVFVPRLALLCLFKWICACLPVCDWTRPRSLWFKLGFFFWVRASPRPCALLMLHGGCKAASPAGVQSLVHHSASVHSAVKSAVSTRAQCNHQPSEVQHFIANTPFQRRACKCADTTPYSTVKTH